MAKRKRISPTQFLEMTFEDMVANLTRMTEKDLLVALDLEVKGRNRSSWLERIHPRTITLRKEREIEELKARGANV